MLLQLLRWLPQIFHGLIDIRDGQIANTSDYEKSIGLSIPFCFAHELKTVSLLLSL